MNSAGVALLDKALDVPASRWQLTMDINLSGTFYMAQAAGRVMTEAGYGRIVNLASQASVIGLDEHAAYCASKAAVVGLTRVLAREWARDGVTVNARLSRPSSRHRWARLRGPERRASARRRRFRSVASPSPRRSQA